jgi:hypothetical protein
MHMTVRGGKSLMRLGYDQGSGGYQSMPTNEDPGRTNVMPPDQEPQPEEDPQPAAELRQGWEQEYAQLFALIEDIPGAVELLDRLVQTSPQEHAAMNGQSAPPGRPSVPTQDTPPAFRGLSRTGARDATYRPMSMATDRRPGRLLRWETDQAEIRYRLALDASAKKRHESEAFLRRWPELKRIRRL